MYQKEVNIEKLAEYADSEWPHIYFFQDDTSSSDGCVDDGGLVSGEYLDDVGLDKSILTHENPELEICKFLLNEGYVLFFSLGMIEDMHEYGRELGEYVINENIDVKIDVEELFRKPKIFKTENKVEFFSKWDDKYLDDEIYRICPNDCVHCFYCLDDEFKYIIAFPQTDDKKYNFDILPYGLYRTLDLPKLNHQIKYMENHFDVVMQVENEFRGYTNGYYGVYVKQKDGKNICDYGYLSEVGGPVCFVGPSLDFYHLDDINSDDEVKKTFIKLIDELDIFD